MKKYYAQTSDQEDLISIGTIGLIKGITPFENGFCKREAWSICKATASFERNTDAANVLGGQFSKDGNRGKR